MLTVCGVQGNGPLNLQLVVANASGDPEQLWSIVCIAGSTKTVIQVGSRPCGPCAQGRGEQQLR